MDVIVSLPPVQEQQAVVEVLAEADGEIATVERKLALLKDQKRYLLNNLVTGTIRLSEFLATGTTVVTNGDRV